MRDYGRTERRVKEVVDLRDALHVKNMYIYDLFFPILIPALTPSPWRESFFSVIENLDIGFIGNTPIDAGKRNFPPF